MRSRLVLAVTAAALALLLAEAGVSITSGSSLLRTLAGVRPSAPLTPFAPPELVDDEQVLEESRLTEGIWRTHPDPLVSYLCKPGLHEPDDHPSFLVSRLGLRGVEDKILNRENTRVLVLGDSVAFGLGVADDEILGAQLQGLLEDLLEPDAPPLAVITAATSGWNHTNAVRFFLDHAEKLDPDVVIYLPVDNDLADSFGVTAAGHRRVAPDVAQADPRLPVSMEAHLAILAAMIDRFTNGLTRQIPPKKLGPLALVSDLGAESRRRLDANADSIARLVQACERRRTRLLLAWVHEDSAYPSYGWSLRERLLDRGLDPPSTVLFERFPKELQQDDDPHPSALGLRVIASMLAEVIQGKGLLPLRPDAELPPRPDGFDAQPLPPSSAEEVAARAQELRDEARAILRSRVDLLTGEGTLQIYGGLSSDGRMGPRLKAMLAARGPHLRVILADPGDLPSLLPLEVQVSVDGRVVGSMQVLSEAEDATCRAEFTLPEEPAEGAVLDVDLEALDWAAMPISRRTQLVAAKLVLLESF
jgi:lysophospholipase L1-like esterase